MWKLEERRHTRSRGASLSVPHKRRGLLRLRFAAREAELCPPASRYEALLRSGWTQSLLWDVMEEIFLYVKALQLTPLWPGMDSTSAIVINNITTIAIMRSAETETTLSELLYLSRQFLCTDPRDHLIALLGLASDVSGADVELLPDYTVSNIELFRRYTLWSLIKRRSLACFSSGHNPLAWDDDFSPSWVPDFTSWDCQPGQPRSFMRFRATLDSEGLVTVSRDLKSISIVGMVLDEIEELGSAPAWDQHPALAGWIVSNRETDVDTARTRIRLSMQSQRQFILECKSIASGPSNSATPKRLEELWRTLTWDSLIKSPKCALPELSTKVADWIDTIETPEEYWDEGWLLQAQEIDPAILVSVGAFSTARRFCRTTMGQLGSMPKYSEVGDKICVFFGRNLPYVIRPYGNGRYRFIGDCYFHGLMYGEAMDLLGLVEAEKITLI
jgi:hypothetical protein